jgi:nicotinate-nucleotide pyrophosphorylase (carboxylating)
MSAAGPLYPLMYHDVVQRALQEDLGLAGDLTSDAVVAEDAWARAVLVSRRAGRIAGLPVAIAAFRTLCPEATVIVEADDGSDVDGGTALAVIEGPARPLLTAERTALNLICRMSGIASATRQAVERIAGAKARIVCTRKTTPGLRCLEKYAVRVGGGSNHRFGLSDGVMIKDNHVVAAGGIRAAVERARDRVGHMVKIEVEVDTLAQLAELLSIGADAVLLDNMNPDELRSAVRMVGGRMITEASGGITLDNLPEIAAAGVDVISLGCITHSAPITDIGLDLDPSAASHRPPVSAPSAVASSREC